MKKKIALLLAAVMTVSMLPMSVFAVSSNRVNKTVTVVQDEYTTRGTNKSGDTKGYEEPPVLSIDPSDVVTSGTSIRLVLENAEWAFKEVSAPAAVGANWANYGARGAQFRNFSTGSDNWEKYEQEVAMGTVDSNVVREAIENQNVIPWKLEVSSGDPKVAIVTLAPITSTQLKNSTTGKDATYDIPLVVKCIKEGDLKITVDASGTTISNSTATFATGTSATGATVTTVSEVNTGRDTVVIEPLAVRETVAGTLKAGQQITLQLTGNFEFVKNPVLISSDYRLGGKSVAAANVEYKGDTLTFNVPDAYTQSSSRLDTIYITTDKGGLEIAPIDEDTDYGDISLVIKGKDITRETIKVGERKDYGFDFKTTEDAPTLLAGRVASGFDTSIGADNNYWGTGVNYFDTNTNVDDEETEAAEVHFTETIKGTWLGTRKLVFTLPEGVKFDYDKTVDSIDEVKYISSYDAVLSKDGRSLSFENVSLPGGDLAEFKMTPYVSIELGFEGEIEMNVYGGGVSEGTIPGVVIGKAIAPIEISTASTSVNMGYQKFDTADIKITEAATGVFLKDKEVTVDIDSVYGSSEMGFADENISYEIEGGELAVKNFKVKGGTISFEIDRESKTAPATITIKNVKIGSTRSVPFGNYDLLVGGKAFVTNYDYTERLNLDRMPLFDNNEGYKFADYIKVITETGTLDEVVKVSIGSTTCLINDVATEMDVAPYIQAASNSTMVPLRFVSLALGIDSVESADESSKVQWDPNTKTVTIFYAAGTNITPIQFTAGSGDMVVGGTKIPMISPSGQSVKAEITDSRMFVPFRALGDALGVKVTWDDATRTAIYNQK